MKQALVVWFTGLSGSGKTTIALMAKEELAAQGFSAQIIDGDVIRKTVTSNLGFSREDIFRNNHIIAQMCREKRHECDVILVPVISPFRRLRQEVREKIGEPFWEVYVQASIETVSKRDPKGLYDLAKQRKIPPMIGSHAQVPYEIPQNPQLRLNTEIYAPAALTRELVSLIIRRFKL